MAMRTIVGKIGSGKTYYAVHHVLTDKFEWNDTTDEFTLKDTRIPMMIYSNIRNMKLGGDLEEEIKTAGGLRKFFHIDFQRNFCRGRNVIYIIDEAQTGQYFHRKFYDVDVLEFFQKQRHVGADVYLITQDIRCLAREFQNLAEYEIRAVRRSHSFGKKFTYKIYSGDECTKTKRIPKLQRVFKMYTSMEIEEGEKIKSSTTKFIIYTLLLIVGAGFAFKYGFMNFIGHMNSKSSVTKQEVGTVEKLNKQSKVVSIVEGPAKVIQKNMFRIIGYVDDDGKKYYIVNTGRLTRVQYTGTPKGVGESLRIDGV
ncbi:MAG: hypothetical protein HN561_13990 [Candidatus Scalindua sp.]|jgi:hypothetical protein|nr:hypothetical protein [Candidatus Scalindua sp.]